MHEAPKKIEPRASESKRSLGFRTDVDTSRYDSIASYPPCRCGAAICPDRTTTTTPQTRRRSDDVRARAREENARRSFYRQTY